MDINTELIKPIIAIGIVGCLAMDLLIIWPVNRWWSKNHPSKPRHPFSPAFTALGVLWVLYLSTYVIPWQHVLVVLAGFIVFGGTMWLLHAIRWKIRD